MIRVESTFSAIACILFAAGGAHGQESATVVLPPVGLTAAEMAQVSIMSAASDYPGWTFTNECHASITFYGADGSTLGTPTTFTIGEVPQIFSAQLPYALIGAAGAIAFVSAQIVLTVEGGGYSALSTPIPLCASLFSLSTHDIATGVTHAFTAGELGFGTEVGSVQVMPCTYMPSSSCSSAYTHVPSQVITLPPVSLVASETVEVGVVSSAAGYSTSPDICGTSTIAFYRADGSAIGSATTFKAGNTPQIFSAQLRYADAGATAVQRHRADSASAPIAAISAQIALNATPGPVAYNFTAPPCPISYSMKTFDSLTGLTHVFLTGQSMPVAPAAAASGDAVTISRPAK
jgi:hypothetical protein